MNWTLDFLPELEKDILHFGRTQQVIVEKAILKVQEKPLPQA